MPVVAVAVATPLAAASPAVGEAPIVFSLSPEEAPGSGTPSMNFTNVGTADFVGGFLIHHSQFTFPLPPGVPVLLDGVEQAPVKTQMDRKFVMLYTFVSLSIRAGTTLSLPFVWGPSSNRQTKELTVSASESTTLFSTSGDLNLVSPA